MSKIINMRLDDGPFERIQNGSKKYEIRLLDEKRRALSVGDTIIFSSRSNMQKTINAKVTGLLNFENFEEMYDALSEKYFNKYGKKEFVDGCNQIYTKYEKVGKEELQSVVIEFELFK